jgi:hypothetical protein
MDADVAKDIKESKRMFRISEPILKKVLMSIPDLFIHDDLEIYCVENQNTELEKHLDTSCGVDYIISDKKANRTIELAWRAIKSKIKQYPTRGVYNAFSLRQKRNLPNSESYCELAKRLDAVQFGLSYPRWTAEVYYDPLDNDSLLSLAVAKSSDILDAYNKGYWRNCNPNDRNKMVFFRDVSWKLMREHGYKIYDWYRDVTCVPTTYLDVGEIQYKNI